MFVSMKLAMRRKFYILILGYSIVISIIYALPRGLETEWYSFYSYLDVHGAKPYIDVREGYPPLGFLIYMPLYYAFQNNSIAFSYSFRALNGALLVATLFTLYLISKSVSEERASELTFYYAALPSVIIANAFSNDVVALLPAALAIYMMVRKRPMLCAALLGLATLGKGFPILLLIPALISFPDMRDRLKLMGVTSVTLIIASLPFMLINPLTYISTFQHHASRGPWETVWALLEGYNSHGGLLHPFFDKFFYHFNLLKVYSATPYDHAIYEWRFSLLPDLLTICHLIMIIILSLAYLRRREETVSLCGLLFISNMLFFKGYSTQFSVSAQFYTLIAAIDMPLVFIIPLELSHILQVISWWGAEFFSFELLRNMHLPFLIFAIILRSIVFAALVMRALIYSQISVGQMVSSIRSSFVYLKLFKDKRVILLISATLLTAMIGFSMIYISRNDVAMFRTFDGSLRGIQDDWQSIELDGLKKGDQVIVRLATKTWLDAEVPSVNQLIQVERGVINPYNLKGSFNETLLFFIAGSESCSLRLRMKHSRIPFRVTDGFDSDLTIDMTSNGSALALELDDEGVDGRSSMLRMAYPCEAYVGNDFTLGFKYEIMDGNASHVKLDVFDDTDEWLYTFDAPEDFVLKSDSKDLSGYSNLSNDYISLVAIVIVLDDGSNAYITLEELSFTDGKNCENIEFYAESGEEIPYEVFIERDFKPSLLYMLTLSLSVVLGIVTLYYLFKNADLLSAASSY